jgi:hypothetical protein
MSTRSLHTILIATATICLAALLAIATTHREQMAGHSPASYGLRIEDGVRSR